ncbi:olfactory receptor 52B6-like [Crassostrea angulata]|uniref:olfactory receptor 52B6-like n=1 Tax=Magallana angulata TaxID=2784310 RepID=UPI0022B1C21D|nr:olfactory receptor 52B6-like [Crassostrea angulata]
MANTYAVIAASVLFCIGLIGNSITVCFVAVSKRLHTPTYVLIGWLAVSDVLASMTRYVQIFVKSLFKDYSHVYLFIYGIFTFLFIHSAFFHMVLVSHVRFVFITNPLHSLILKCKKILLMSFAVWIGSIVVFIGYGININLSLIDMVSIETAVLAEVGFALYVSGLPFIIVIVFNVRKLYYLYNQTASVRRARIANLMSLMFWIIIVIYLLSTIYPFIYTINYALFNGSLLDSSLDLVNKMFFVSLLLNSLNPLIYFMFSPPVLRFLSRLRKCFNNGTDRRISNPKSCPQVE